MSPHNQSTALIFPRKVKV